MQNAISTLNILPTTKDEIKIFTSMVINELESGNFDGLPLAVKLSAMEKTIKDIKDHPKYKELIRAEAEKYGTNSFDFYNAKIELAEVGTKYDFSSTNDFELFDMEKEFEELKTKIDERKAFLKTIKGEVFGSDGVQLFAPIKSSTSSIKITLK